MVLSSNMPSEFMDQRNTSSFYKSAMTPSFYSEKIRFPSEKHVEFWGTASMPDHSGIDAMPFMRGGKSVSSSALVNNEHNFVGQIDHSQMNSKEPQKYINIDCPQIGAASIANSWRISDHDVASMSKLYSQPPVSQKAGIDGGYYENGLFSSSMSDLFNRRRGLISNDVTIGQSTNTTISNLGDVEAFESSEEIEAQTIGDLLPDDDDLFSGAIHNQGHVPQYNWTDVEDDLFCSVGGLELESDHNINPCTKIASETDYGKEVNSKSKPQPSRVLLVKNIDSVEDTELRALFELYGDLQIFNSFSKNRGFIMVSYYDIRAAQNAEMMLQAWTIKGQKLDIQFYVSKDVFSEIQTSDGVLFLTNIDMSVSNDDLLHIFGRIGEIKEIREISQNWQYRIIEFYDVRSADAAISAFNGCDIAGKRIQVEPWCLRASRFSSFQKSTLDIEDEESGRIRQEIYPQKTLSGFGTSSNHQNGTIQGSIPQRTFGIPYNIPRHIPSQSTVSVIGNNDSISGNCELSHSLGKMNLGSQNMASFPEFHDGILSGIQFNSPNTMSAMAMNMNSTLVSNGIDCRNIQRVGSIGNTSHSFELNKSAFNSPQSHDYVWNDSNAFRYHHPGSMSWQNLAPFMNSNIIQAQTPQVPGLSRGPSHMPNRILAPNHHVGSAPSIAFHPSSLGSMGYSSCSPLHSFDFSSNIFPSANGSNLESSMSSAHIGTPSSQPRTHTYRAKSNTSTRSRRSHSSANQSDSSRQFDLDLDRISRGEDLRTTLMIKNIPNKYTSKMLLATIDEQHKGTYDFIYLPIDFKNKCNVGYAFINMTDPQHIIPFYKAFNGKKWEKFNSEKVAYLAYARIQGKSALIGHFQNSSLMSEDKRCRPILFHTNGPNAGDQEPFPVPVGANIRYRRSRTGTENNQGSMSGSSSEEDESSTSPKDFE